MSSIIKASQRHAQSPGSAFNLNDVEQRANSYLQDVQRQADQIRSAAREDAEKIRQQAEQEGQRAALAAVDQVLQERVTAELQTLVPALQNMVQETEHLKNTWQLHWQKAAVHLATEIAEKIIRRELQSQPEISPELIAEALKLAIGSSDLQVRLNPVDHNLLEHASGALEQVLSRVAPLEFKPDESISPGGCRIDTQHGQIDATIETQLARIEDELNR